jgi:hypothetical protein
MSNALEAFLAKNINKFDKDINKIADKLAQKEFKRICKSAEHDAIMHESSYVIPTISECLDIVQKKTIKLKKT